MVILTDSKEDDPLYDMFINAVLHNFVPGIPISFEARKGYYLANVTVGPRSLTFGSTRALLEDATEELLIENVRLTYEEMRRDPRFL